jgi:hypothetical protein
MFKKNTVIYWVSNISPKKAQQYLGDIFYYVLEARETIVKKMYTYMPELLLHIIKYVT